jgi:dTDP-L-rhamnose 4-epimerase
MSKVLVTGGAGFIGTHLVEALLHRGHSVRVLDSLVSQVHSTVSDYYRHDVEFIRGDMRDRSAVDRALKDVDVIYHDAAEVGVGQSMYEIHRYVDANTLGTAVLLEALARNSGSVRKLVVASSMSIYGEGAYECARCGELAPGLRGIPQLESREWELRCPRCDEELNPIPTAESKPLDPASVYAVTKQDQEQLCLIVGRAYNIPTVALRYFNVYGPGQALSNPYTGVIAIFSGRLLNQQRPVIFEDGLQSRDFAHVSDIVRANLLAMESDAANYCAINVGTGVSTSVLRISELLAEGLEVDLPASVVGKFREGDIRHCVADISRARELLGYEPQVALEEGIPQLLDWVREQQAVDRVEYATSELEAHGLVK